MNKIVIVLAGLSFLSLVACSASTEGNGEKGSSTSSAQSADTASFCEKICKRDAACDSDVDVQTCTAKCEGIAIDKLRADAVESIVTCYEGSDCKSILSEKSRLGSCVEETSSSIGATDAARAFCAAWGKKADECGDYTVHHAKCLDAVKIFSTQTLETATKCTKKVCSAVVPCIDAEISLDN